MRLSAGRPFFLAYLALHALIVAGVKPGVYPDSESYFHVNLLGGATRLPTVPLLYEIFPTNFLRMWAQVLLAAVAWWTLAVVASSYVADRRPRIGLRIVILALGVTGPVANWNSLMLSESVAISLSALLIAAWLDYARQPNVRAAAQVLTATLAWTFTRQSHVLLTLGVAVGAIVATLVARRRDRVGAALAAGLLLVGFAGLLEIHRNQAVSRANTGAVIQERLLLNPSWTRWLVAHGMPYSRSIASHAGQPYRAGSRDPALVSWVRRRGTATYIRFAIENPGYSLIAPLRYFPGEQASLRFHNLSPEVVLDPNPTPSLLSPIVNYGRHRNVLPSVVDSLLFDQGQIGDVLLLGALGTFVSLGAWRRCGPDRRVLVPVVLAASAVPQGYVVWLGAVSELDRLSMVTAVSLRVALWLLLALAADRLLSTQAA